MAAAGSSRFAVTCGLMRQYMREQQQQQGAGAPRPAVATTLLPPPPTPPGMAEAEDAADARTMQLFPTTAAGVPPQPSSQERPEAQAKAPLTIFYDGRALVFEDFPAEKAKVLMQLAGSTESPPAPAEMAPPAAALTQPPALSDMPIARKASLQRFLAKRKHRISTSDPYQKPTASPLAPEKDAAVKPEKDEPASWLGL